MARWRTGSLGNALLNCHYGLGGCLVELGVAMGGAHPSEDVTQFRHEPGHPECAGVGWEPLPVVDSVGDRAKGR